MSIDLDSEALITMNAAATLLPTIDGRQPHPASVWRWCKKGVNGVRLDYVRVGYRVLTSREAVARFLAELAEADLDPDKGRPVKPMRKRKRKNRTV